MKRFIFTVLLLGIVVYAPWWITLVAAGIVTFMFPWYIEVIFTGIFFDVLYGAIGVSFFGLGVLGFVTGLTLFFGMEKVKQNLR